MAARYFITGTGDGLWNTNGNWSATDGGAASGVKPTAADDVFFTANSPNCNAATTNIVAKTVTFTGYTGKTFTLTINLTLSGSLTLISGMTFTVSGTRTITINASATLTFGGLSPTCLFSFLTGGAIIQLADNWVAGNTVTISGDLGSLIQFKSNSAGVQRKLTIPQGKLLDLDFVTATDIDSSDGITAWNYKGTQSNCVNWMAMPFQKGTISY